LKIVIKKLIIDSKINVHGLPKNKCSCVQNNKEREGKIDEKERKEKSETRKIKGKKK
jgi:hypothetical protein